MAATHYESIKARLDHQSIDEARRLAEATWAGGTLEPDRLLHHMGGIVAEGRRTRDMEQMFRGAMVSFWATARICQLMDRAANTPYRYSNCTNHGYDKIVAATNLTNDPQGLNAQAQLCWHLGMHEQCGRQVYQVSPGLAQRLALTELRGITTDLLHLPFEAVYIQIPLEADLWIHNHETAWHRCVGAYIVEDPQDPEGDRCWRIMAVGESKGRGGQGREGLMIDNDALIHFRIKLPGDARLEDVIRETMVQTERDVATVSSNFRGMLDEWPHVFRWLMNAMIYATWPDHEPMDVWANDHARKLWEKTQRGPSNGKPARRARQKLSKMDPQKRTVLGHTIVLDRSWPRRPGPGAPAGQPLEVRQRVAGHLKRVWCGKGKTEWRIKRIDPYFRGSGHEVASLRRLT